MKNTLLNLQHLGYLKQKDARLGETIEQVQNIINAIQTGQTSIEPPSQIQSISVTQTNGDFDVVIQDNTPFIRGMGYFIEWDTSPNFTQPRVIHNGASRTLNIHLPSLNGANTYWRAYSQYYGSSPSKPVTFGNPPTAIVSAGGASPAAQPSTGSGTASNTGNQGGSGYGQNPTRQPSNTKFAD